MKNLVTLFVLVLLTGCNAIAGWKNFEETSYVKISEGEAGGLVKMVQGSAQYCMVSLHKIDDYTAIDASYDDGVCKITFKPAGDVAQ